MFADPPELCILSLDEVASNREDPEDALEEIDEADEPVLDEPPENEEDDDDRLTSAEEAMA